MADHLDEPGDELMDLRLERLEARLDALDGGNERILELLDELEAAERAGKLRLVKGGDDG